MPNHTKADAFKRCVCDWRCLASHFIQHICDGVVGAGAHMYTCIHLVYAWNTINKQSHPPLQNWWYRKNQSNLLWCSTPTPPTTTTKIVHEIRMTLTRWCALQILIFTLSEIECSCNWFFHIHTINACKCGTDSVWTSLIFSKKWDRANEISIENWLVIDWNGC